MQFILALIDTMAARYAIDRNRVYQTGFSMGGMMGYALVCGAADKFAAVAPISGYLLGNAGNNCSPKRPVPILHMHGAADDFVKDADLKGFLSTSMAKFNCPTAGQVTSPYPSKAKLTREYWGPCGAGSEVSLISIAGLAHAYTTGPDIHETQEAWAFFKRFSLNNTTAVPRPEERAKGISAFFSGGRVRLEGMGEYARVRLFDTRGRLIMDAPRGQKRIGMDGKPGGLYSVLVSEKGKRTASLKFVLP